MDTATIAMPAPAMSIKPKLDHKPGTGTIATFLCLLVVGLGFGAWSLIRDVSEVGSQPTTFLPYLLLGVALLIALGFEFVNGFHDTANAVATVIYTHSLPPNFAVVWSGLFNLAGCCFPAGRWPSGSSPSCPSN